MPAFSDASVQECEPDRRPGATAAPCRLQIVSEPAALSRVLDRLTVLDLLPNVLHFQQQEAGDAVFQLEWKDLEASRALNLRDRLAQIPAVRTVRFVEAD